MPDNNKKLKAGLVTTVSGRWPQELPESRHNIYLKKLRERFPQVDIVVSDGIVPDRQRLLSTIEKFRLEDVDTVIILLGAFTGDNVCSLIAEKLSVPVVVWAPPEPPFNGNRIMANSLVAATMNQAALKRLGYDNQFIYGDIDDNRCLEEISGYFKMYGTIKRLGMTYLGLIGYRPTGFYSSQFDETLIRKTFGISIESYDLLHLINQAENIDEAEIEKDMKKFKASVRCINLPEEHLRNHSKLYLGLKKIIDANSFGALAFKCWPELGSSKYTPCAAISRLADEGIIIGCETDVDATITMLAQNYLSGRPVFMSDLVDIKEKDNTALFWHCGQAGRRLHEKKEDACGCDHPMAGQGVVIEGALKQGRVTVSLMTKIGNEYRLFIAGGKAIPTAKEVKGVMIRVRMDNPVRDMIYKIAAEGIPHHYSIVWEDICRELKLLAGNLGIKIIEG